MRLSFDHGAHSPGDTLSRFDPAFEVRLQLVHCTDSAVNRTRTVKITKPMGLRRSVNTALRMGLWTDTTPGAWRCIAVVPRAFADRFGLTVVGKTLHLKGAALCEGSIS